jgi:hypothetical protein
VKRGVFVTGVGLAVGVLLVAFSGCGGSSPRRVGATWQSDLKWLGSTQTIVSAKVPGGPQFSIVGSRYRFWGRDYLQIQESFSEPWRVAATGSSSGWGDGMYTGRSRLFLEELEVAGGCQVRPFVIMHGLLKRSGDAVFARVGSRMVRLPEVALPSSLGGNGVLVYGSAPTVPTGFEVRTPSGRLLDLNKLSSGHSIPEGCAGQEREWVEAHFGHAHAGEVLVKIARCLQQRGFEVGAPDEPPFGFGRSGRNEWRQYKAAQELCRTQAGATVT